VCRGGGGIDLNLAWPVNVNIKHPVVANRRVPLEWESFVLVNLRGGDLTDGCPVALQSSNGYFVCAENGGGGQVNANRKNRAQWETFTVKKLNGGGTIQNGDRVALLCYDQTHYLQAYNGGGGTVKADPPWAREWETFTIRTLPRRKVRIEILRVDCSDKESLCGPDHFYVAGAAVNRIDSQSGKILTNVTYIGKGEEKSFQPDERVVFDGEVDCASTICLGVAAYDRDSAANWKDRKQTLDQFSNAAAVALATLGPTGTTAGAVLKVATEVGKFFIDEDKDDLLGQLTRDIPVLRMSLPSSEHTWHFAEDGPIGYSTWDYEVTYGIYVS
jgi:hypothetical protein